MKSFALAVLVVVAAAMPFAIPAVSQEVDGKSELIQIEPKEGGWEIEELFRLITQYTGESIVYDPASPQIARKKIEFVGTQTVPREKLFAWFQSLLSFQRLILVPVGPKGHEQWMALDTNSPQITNRPIFVPEDEIMNWADRDGVYLVSTITVKYLQDTSRARNALAQLATRTIGRINDVPGSKAFVVGDFAPVVASMYQLLKRMDIEGSLPMTTTPRGGRVPAKAKTRVTKPKIFVPPPEVAYLERMLMDSDTNVAAQYFISRLNALTLKSVKK